MVPTAKLVLFHDPPKGEFTTAGSASAIRSNCDLFQQCLKQYRLRGDHQRHSVFLDDHVQQEKGQG
jgi:hypothetical protein